MTSNALIFFPRTYAGFNKTQLIERQLGTVGVIGSRFKATSVFSMGPHYRQFIPKVKSIQQFQRGIIRIQILSVGVWAIATESINIDEHSNVVIIEGDSISHPLDRYAPFCDLLLCITGDEYDVGVVSGSAGGGIAERRKRYQVDMHTA